MAHSHSHEEGGHSGHDHTAGANSRSLMIALALTGTFLIAELVGAWLFNSLGVNLCAVRASIGGVEGVTEVHDLHLWSIAGCDLSLTAHVALEPGSAADPVRLAVSEALHERFDISHATLQMEADGEQCAEPEHD